jgi:signal transduction histidine kinase
LDDVGLEAAVRALVDRFNHAQAIRISLRCQGLLDRVTDPVASAAYRVIQEAMVNAQRHSGAGEIHVSLGTDLNWLHIGIADDGIGFDTGRERYSGLQYMHDRVQAVSGTIKVASQRGQGTRIDVDMPVYIEKAGQPRLRETDRQ